MKNRKKAKNIQLKPEAQNRLIAYSTAASLGAFFGGQTVEAQVTASAAFAPYPHTILPNVGGTGPSTDYHYFSVDGGAAVPPGDFNLNVNSNRVDISGTITLATTNLGVVTPGTTNLILDPVPTSAYVVPWTVGTIINATNGAPPAYKRFLANGYNLSYHVEFTKFPTNEAMGFSFVSGLDHQTHFGYMNIQVTTATNAGSPNQYVGYAVITGVYYNKTPNVGIAAGALPPAVVTVTNISVKGTTVTINFTSTDNAAASAFTLLTSPTLGAGANWAADPAATITSSTPGVYQATTTAAGGAAQFYLISDSN